MKSLSISNMVKLVQEGQEDMVAGATVPVEDFAACQELLCELCNAAKQYRSCH